MRIFISTDGLDHRDVAFFIETLKAAHLDVDHSPDPGGNDPRWGDWYDHGLEEAVSKCDYFVAIETSWYESSSWMAQEFFTAYHHYAKCEKPRLFLWKRTDHTIPWLRSCEKDITNLPSDKMDAVNELLKGCEQSPCSPTTRPSASA